MLAKDRPTVQVETRIVGDPAAIWALVTDIELPLGTSPELQAVRWLDDATGVAVGNRFLGTNRNDSLGEWQTVATVVEVDPGRRWVYDIHNGDDWMTTWGFEVDPGREAVTVRQWVRLGPDPSGLTAAAAADPDREARVVSHRMRHWQAAMEANLETIRTRIGEGTHP